MPDHPSENRTPSPFPAGQGEPLPLPPPQCDGEGNPAPPSPSSASPFPSQREGGQGASALTRCPFCGSADVELLALFGSQLLTDQYYCRACRTPFEHLKDDE